MGKQKKSPLTIEAERRTTISSRIKDNKEPSAGAKMKMEIGIKIIAKAGLPK